MQYQKMMGSAYICIQLAVNRLPTDVLKHPLDIPVRIIRHVLQLPDGDKTVVVFRDKMQGVIYLDQESSIGEVLWRRGTEKEGLLKTGSRLEGFSTMPPL
ncbi:hypothetical protein CK934_24355 [Chitinophaga sp. MD30]|nr:hypothetical protein CK934_24355 [Chitinophaga sp. MD30]